MPGRLGQPRIARYQGSSESLTERHECCVVSGEVVAQLPHAVKESAVRIPHDRHLLIVLPCSLSAAVAQLAVAHQPAQGMRDLDVDQVRRVEVTIGGEPRDESRTRRLRDESAKDRRAVENQQALRAIASGANGIDDRVRCSSASPELSALEDVCYGWSRGNPADLVQQVVGQR